MNNHDSTTTALVIADITIQQDNQGRYSLNALHQASEYASDEAKAPNRWARLKSTKALVQTLQDQTPDLAFDVVKGGEHGGTYVHELLAISYAGWISPTFQLKVNQAFLDMKRGVTTQAVPITATPAEVALALAQAVVTIERRQHVIEARQDEQAAAIDDLRAQRPPEGKMTAADWLRATGKSRLERERFENFQAHARRLETAEPWTAPGRTYPDYFYTPSTLEAAYKLAMRQLILFSTHRDGNSTTRDASAPYKRTRRATR